MDILGRREDGGQEEKKRWREGRKEIERKESRWYVWLMKAGLGAGNFDEMEESDMPFLNEDTTSILNKSLLGRTI